MTPTEMLNPARWIDEHGDAMFRYAMLRLGDRSAAEDAVQEALLAGLKAADSYEGRSAERTWLIGILRHKVLDAIRARRRDRAPEPEAVAPPRTRGHCHESLWPIGPGDAEREEILAIVREELALLGSPAREAICLRIIEGLDSKTVCDILGLTPTNLWTIVHRGRVKLRERVGARLEDDGDPKPS
jgi:RNA polymerase sigma factor (sigma-70 family)